MKTGYFKKLLFIKKFRQHGCVGKSLGGHWLIMSEVAYRLWAWSLLPAVLECVVYYIYIWSTEKGHLIQIQYCTYKSKERYHNIWQSIEKISVGTHLHLSHGGIWKNKLHVPEFHDMGTMWRTQHFHNAGACCGPICFDIHTIYNKVSWIRLTEFVPTAQHVERPNLQLSAATIQPTEYISFHPLCFTFII